MIAFAEAEIVNERPLTRAEKLRALDEAIRLAGEEIDRFDLTEARRRRESDLQRQSLVQARRAMLRARDELEGRET